jgi:hypothetical protein
MDTFQATEVKVSDIRVGDLVNNNWIVSGIDTDNDNGFIRYIISYTHTDTGEEWTNDYLPNDVVTYRHKESNELQRAIQAVKVSIDTINPEESQLIADLWSAVELLEEMK